MNIEEYQEKAKRTVNTNLQFDEQVPNLCMGLCGESGEVVDYLKKCIYHSHSFNLQKLTEELGDVMWYLSNIATLFAIPMTYILDEYFSKLEERYPEGFRVEK